MSSVSDPVSPNPGALPDTGFIAYPQPAVAWITVAALFVAYIFSFIDRMIIGLLVEPMKADLDLSDTEISLLQGLAFAVFYTFAGIPIGRFIDRSSRIKIVAAGISIWSVMTMLCGLSVQYWQLFLARIGVGVGEATLSPAAYSIISDSFPPRQLGLAMGVYVLGSAVGAGLAFLIGAVIISLVARADDIVIPLVGGVRMWQAQTQYGDTKVDARNGFGSAPGITQGWTLNPRELML
jgi:MFS family permease